MAKAFCAYSGKILSLVKDFKPCVMARSHLSVSSYLYVSDFCHCGLVGSTGTQRILVQNQVQADT